VEFHEIIERRLRRVSDAFVHPEDSVHVGRVVDLSTVREPLATGVLAARQTRLQMPPDGGSGHAIRELRRLLGEVRQRTHRRGHRRTREHLF
jgi:hypothetical protein